MNKYFENEKKIESIKNQIDKYLSMVKILTKKQDELLNTCNHTNKDGSSAITWKSDGGHGHIIYTCSVCKEWGNRTWVERTLKL